MTADMADKTIIAVREAAAEDTTDPGLVAEYANLVEQEKRAAGARLDAITEAGFEVPSIDEGDPDA